MNRITIPTSVKQGIKAEPMYELVNGGNTVLIKSKSGKSGYDKSLNVHHISELGVMCEDLETFIEWDKF